MAQESDEEWYRREVLKRLEARMTEGVDYFERLRTKWRWLSGAWVGFVVPVGWLVVRRRGRARRERVWNGHKPRPQLTPPPQHSHPTPSAEEPHQDPNTLPNLVIFSGSSHPLLTEEICDYLNIPMGRSMVKRCVRCCWRLLGAGPVAVFPLDGWMDGQMDWCPCTSPVLLPNSNIRSHHHSFWVCTHMQCSPHTGLRTGRCLCASSRRSAAGTAS